MKKWITNVAGLLVLLVLLSPVLLYVAFPLVNNIRLHHFAAQLDGLPPMAGVAVLEKQAICGKLSGNGNGMDFFACVLVQTNLPEEALCAAYAQNDFQPVQPREKEYVEFFVVPVYGETLDSPYLEHGKITFAALRQEVVFVGYYALVLYDGGYSAAFDVRGH